MNRRVQKDLLRIITGLSMNRQITTGSQGITYSNQSSTQAGVPTQTVSENTPYQHIPERKQDIQNLMGEFQCPPDVTEQEHGAANNTGQARENNNQDPILNQRWDEQLQLQPPLRPTNVNTSQTTNNIINIPRSNSTEGTSEENSAIH